MKIVILGPANNPHIEKWANKFIELNQTVYLIYLKNHSPRTDEINNQVKLFELNYSGTSGYYLNCLKLKKIINQIKPDIIHTHYASGYGTLARISKIHPIVLSVWGSDIYEFPKKNILNRYILKKNLKNADFLTSTSNCMKQETLKYTNKPIKVIPFGIDKKIFKKNNIIKSNDDTIIISTFKSLEHIYGLEYAIDGVALFIKKYSTLLNKKIIYRIYGSGSLYSFLKKKINDEKLNENIFLMGRVSNKCIPDILSSTDVTLYTSINESFGVSLVESMACEVPVIASINPGFEEVLDNGKNGVLVNQFNPDDIARKLYELLSNDAIRKKYVIRGKHKVDKEYDWDNNVQSMVLFMESCLKIQK